MTPLITVVIPTLNRVSMLKEALNSVLSQSTPELECIVSDNCSSDGTAAFLEAKKHPNLRVVRPPKPMDVTTHWEFAIRQARGGYILFLGDDDLLASGCLDRLFSQARSHSHGIITVGYVKMEQRSVSHEKSTFRFENRSFAGKGHALPTQPLINDTYAYYGLMEEGDFESQYRPFRFHPSVIVVRRDLIERARARQGTFFIPPMPDVGYFAAFVEAGEGFFYIDLPLVVVRVHDNSGTSQYGRGDIPKSVLVEPLRHTRLSGCMHINYAAEALLRLFEWSKDCVNISLPKMMPKFYIEYHRQLQAVKHTVAQYAEWNAEFFNVVNSLEETDRNEVIAGIRVSKLTAAQSALKSSIRHSRLWPVLQKAKQKYLRMLRKPHRVDAAELGLHSATDIANHVQKFL